MATTKPASIAQLCSNCAGPLTARGRPAVQQIHETTQSFVTAVEQGCLVCCGLFRQLCKESQKVLVDDPLSPRICIYQRDLSRPLSAQAARWNTHPNLTVDVMMYRAECDDGFSLAGDYQLNMYVMNPDEWRAYSEAVARAAQGSEEVRAGSFFTKPSRRPRMRLSPLAKYMETRRDEIEFQPGSVTSSSTNSDETFRKIRFWLEKCEKHASCNEQSRLQKAAHWLPTRLVKVEAAQENAIGVAGMECRIVETKSEELPDDLTYVTLSHRWMQDPRRTAKLSTNNLEPWKKRLPLEDFSQTYRDAFQIAQKLNISYVWIDSLCIIQEGSDAKKDWDIEARMMHRIYSNAKFNMGAGCGEAEDGMFTERDPATLIKTQLDLGAGELLRHDADTNDNNNLNAESADSGPSYWRQRNRYFLLSEVEPARTWRTKVDGTPLATRGWVFQEQLLSRANIYFGPDEVLFECREMRACESVATTQDYDPRYHSWPGMKHGMKASLPLMVYQDATTEISRADRLNQGYESWNTIVWLYSARQLTKPEDRLVAIAGLAQYFKRNILDGDVFLAGLWRSHLAIELMWHLRPGAVKPAWEGLSSHWAKRSRCFSFSWVCVIEQTAPFPRPDFYLNEEGVTFAQVTCIKLPLKTESEDMDAGEGEPFNEDIFSLEPAPPSIQLQVTGLLRQVSLVMPSTASEPALETRLDNFVNEKKLRLILGRHTSMPEKYLPLDGNTRLDIDVTLRDLMALNEDGRLFTMHIMRIGANTRWSDMSLYLLVLVLVDPTKGRYRRIGIHEAVVLKKEQAEPWLECEGPPQTWDGPWEDLRELPCGRYDEAKKEHTIYIL